MRDDNWQLWQTDLYQKLLSITDKPVARYTLEELGFPLQPRQADRFWGTLLGLQSQECLSLTEPILNGRYIEELRREFLPGVVAGKPLPDSVQALARVVNRALNPSDVTQLMKMIMLDDAGEMDPDFPQYLSVGVLVLPKGQKWLSQELRRNEVIQPTTTTKTQIVRVPRYAGGVLWVEGSPLEIATTGEVREKIFAYLWAFKKTFRGRVDINTAEEDYVTLENLKAESGSQSVDAVRKHIQELNKILRKNELPIEIKPLTRKSGMYLLHIYLA